MSDTKASAKLSTGQMKGMLHPLGQYPVLLSISLSGLILGIYNFFKEESNMAVGFIGMVVFIHMTVCVSILTIRHFVEYSHALSSESSDRAQPESSF